MKGRKRGKSFLLNATSPGRNSAPRWISGEHDQYSNYTLKSKQTDILTLAKLSLGKNSIRIIITMIRDDSNV